MDHDDDYLTFLCPRCGAVCGFDEDGRAVITGIKLERVKIVRAVVRWCACGHQDAGHLTGHAYVHEWALTPLLNEVWRDLVEGEPHQEQPRTEPGE